MKPAIAIRPEPGLSATLAAGRAAGLEMAGFALFETRALAWQAPDLQQVDALLIGSANAIRLGGEALKSCAGKPVYAVGETTAQAAREAGFSVAMTGQGGLQSLLDQLAGQRMRLLRVSAADHVALSPPAGIEVAAVTAYAAAKCPMPARLAELLAARPVVVLLHSGEAAGHFSAECGRLSLDKGQVAVAALGPRIAASAGAGWAECGVADMPSEAALLALVRDMCQ